MKEANNKEHLNFINTKLQPQYIPEGLDQNLILKEQEKLFKSIRLNKLNVLYDKYITSKKDCNNTIENNTIDAKDKLAALIELTKEKDPELIEEFYLLRKAFAYEKQKCLREKVLEMLKDRIGIEDIMASTFYCQEDELYAVKMAKIEEGIKKRENLLKMERQKALCEEIKENYKRNFVNKVRAHRMNQERIVESVRRIHDNLAEYERNKVKREYEKKILNMSHNDIDRYAKHKEELKQKQLTELNNLFEVKQKEWISVDLTFAIKDLLKKDTSEANISAISNIVKYYENNENCVMFNEIPMSKIRILKGFVQSLNNFKNSFKPIIVIVSNESVRHWTDTICDLEHTFDLIKYRGTSDSRKTVLEMIKAEKQSIVFVPLTSFLKDHKLLYEVEWNSIICACDNISEVETILPFFTTPVHKLLFTNATFDSSLPNLWTIGKFINFKAHEAPCNVFEYLNAPIAFLDDCFEFSDSEMNNIKNMLLAYIQSFATKTQNNVNILMIPLTNIQEGQYNFVKNMHRRRDDVEVKRVKTVDSSENKIMIELTKQFDTSTILDMLALHPYIFEKLRNHYKGCLNEGLYYSSSKMIVLHKLTDNFNTNNKKALIIFTNSDFMSVFIRFLNEKKIPWKNLQLSTVSKDDGQDDKVSIYLYLYVQFDASIESQLNPSFDIFLVDNPDLAFEIMVGIKSYNSINCLITQNTREEKYLYTYNTYEDVHFLVYEYPFTNNSDMIDPKLTFPDIPSSHFDKEIAKQQKMSQVVYSDTELKSNLMCRISNAKKDGNDLVDIFLELPLAEDYPDYYDIIKTPISIHEINEKMFDDGYNIGCMVNDFILMFDNAMKYNTEGSRIYKNALYLKKQVQNFYIKKVANQ